MAPDHRPRADRLYFAFLPNRQAAAAGRDGLFCPSVTSRLFCQDGVGSAAGRTVRLDAVLPSLESLQCRIAGCRKLEAIPLTLLMYSTVIDQVSKFVISLFSLHL